MMVDHYVDSVVNAQQASRLLLYYNRQWLTRKERLRLDRKVTFNVTVEELILLRSWMKRLLIHIRVRKFFLVRPAWWLWGRVLNFLTVPQL